MCIHRAGQHKCVYRPIVLDTGEPKLFHDVVRRHRSLGSAFVVECACLCCSTGIHVTLMAFCCDMYLSRRVFDRSAEDRCWSINRVQLAPVSRLEFYAVEIPWPRLQHYSHGTDSAMVDQYPLSIMFFVVRLFNLMSSPMTTIYRFLWWYKS
jgi:hypothetical protein